MKFALLNKFSLSLALISCLSSGAAAGAVSVIPVFGEGKVTSLIVISQVILSFQLPFAVIPLIQFTSSRARMGEFVNSRLTTVIAWGIAAAILFFNAEYATDVR